MRIDYVRVTAATALLGLCAGFAMAQRASEKYLISAKAGGVNEIVGDVTIERAEGRIGRLFRGDEVQAGQKVSTGVDGKTEILMNPGSYIRLGANSSFEFESTDLDDVRIRMHKGSALLEVLGVEDFDVSLFAGNSKFTLLETGIYRVDVAADGNAAVSVEKGKVRTGDASDKPFGKGKKAEFSGNDYAIAKFDRDDKDELDTWSRERAKTLSKLSASLKRDTIRDPLISSFWGGRWNFYSTFGLWVYNPFSRTHCFLPFNYGWSPYGYGFGRPIWNYNLPTAIYRQPPPVSVTVNPRSRVEPSNGDRTERRGTRPNMPRRMNPSGDAVTNTGTGVREQTQRRVDMPRVSSPSTEPVVTNPRLPSIGSRKVQP